MAGIALCEPRRLYNILNQYRRFPRLSEPNYLCLLDARTQCEYNDSHIITARRIEQSPTGEYLVPDYEELRCVRYCVVYDYETSSLDCCDNGKEEKEEGTCDSCQSRPHCRGTVLQRLQRLTQIPPVHRMLRKELPSDMPEAWSGSLAILCLS